VEARKIVKKPKGAIIWYNSSARNHTGGGTVEEDGQGEVVFL
jgi:hypothetical protein